MSRSLPRVALIWSQFAPYHSDRCEAVAQRLEGRAEVLAVEVAPSSDTYAWVPSGDLRHGRKVTLFADANYDRLGDGQRFRAMWSVLRRCDTVFMGIPYSQKDVIALSWLLRFTGTRLVMMSDSKFDDSPRDSRFELAKAVLLAPYRAALVAGRRQADYLRFLLFRRRRVLIGYDTVSVERIRSEIAAAQDGPVPSFEQRDFLYLGRFVAKKQLLRLIRAYAAYVALAGGAARRLVLAGDGPDEPAMRALVAELGLADRVEFTGFLQGAQVSQAMGRALALLLVSTGEQWGLVINEALAAGLPVIVNQQVGATDTLVRNLVNGYVVNIEEEATLVQAMLRMGASRAEWEAMVAASHTMAERGDVARFADAVELLALPADEATLARYRAFEASVLEV